MTEEKDWRDTIQELCTKRGRIVELLLRPRLLAEPSVDYSRRHDTECMIFDPRRLALHVE